jgi:hypothetical protein
VAAELTCTCGPGETVAGTRQEIIERRLATHFEMEIETVHALLDLHVKVLDAVLDEFPDGSPEGEVSRRIARASRRSEEWVAGFCDLWEFEAIALDKELPNPWGPVFRSLGSNPRFNRTKGEETQ